MCMLTPNIRCGFRLRSHARKKKTGRNVSLIHFAHKTFPINPFDAPVAAQRVKVAAAAVRLFLTLFSVAFMWVFELQTEPAYCQTGHQGHARRTSLARTHARTHRITQMPLPAHPGRGRHAYN